MPTPEILAALGPENNVPIQRLLPNPLFVAAGKPMQFLASPVCRGSEQFIRAFIAQSLQLYNVDIDPGNIELFVQSNGFPLWVPVVFPDPQDPNAPPLQDIVSIARRATVITCSTSVDLPVLLAPLAPMLQVKTIDPAFLASLKRTEGKNEYYDLTPPNYPIPQRSAIGLLDERTIVIAEGTEADIKAVFSDILPKNAILDRLKHTPIEANELTVIASLEALPVSQETFRSFLEQIEQAGSMPSHFIPLISQHLRAISLSLNVSAAKGQPIISLFVEGRSEKGGEAMREAIQGRIIDAQTTMAAMNEDAKQLLLIPPDFAASLLNAMTVDVKGATVNVALNNFETLIPTVTEYLGLQQTLIQNAQIRDDRIRQLVGHVEIFANYYEEHKKFPADILDADGKPLLSWRVAILPSMGLGELYNKFKLDEPWDSETNRELLNTPPMLFVPLTGDIAPVKSVIRFFDSAGTPFSNRNLTVEEIKSPQTTLMFVVVSPQYAVEWTKPESLSFDSEKIGDILLSPVSWGVTFTRQVTPIPIVPGTEPGYEEWKRRLESLIKGLPLPLPQQGPPPQEPQEAGI